MKNHLKLSSRLALSFALVASALAVSADARQDKGTRGKGQERSLSETLKASADAPQGRDARVISAKAGGVNLVAGGAEFRRAGEKAWLSLSTKDDLKTGDAVRTAAGSRVELLLNPGSYWRAGGETEFELVDTSHDDLRVRLARGGAVVEATGFGDFEVALNIVTPQTRVRIARAGVYRLSVLPTGETVLVVEKGRAYVGEGEGLKVKGGKVVRVGASGAPEVAKFDKKTRDELDLWSRERGKELAKANEKLSLRHANTMLANLDFDRYFTAANPGHGFWFWNGASNCYTFLSFYPGWRSPYGYGYGSWFYNPYYGGCGSCPSRRVYNGGVYAGNNGGGGYAGNSGGVVAGSGGVTNAPNSGGAPTAGPRPDAPRSEPRPMPEPMPRGGREMPIREREIEPGFRRDQ
jgi:hypothetical protein